VGGLTGTIADTAARATFDKRYIRKRIERRERDRPGHILEGFAGAGKDILNGVKEGVSGVWQHPAREAKVREKNKGVGTLKGISMGVLGVLIKPPVGVMDALTKLLNGIGNGTELARLRKQAEFVQTRRERMVYGPMSHIRPYNDEDALVWEIMSNLRYEYGAKGVLPRERYLCHIRTLQEPLAASSSPNTPQVKLSRLIMTDHRVMSVTTRKTKNGFLPRVRWSILWEDVGGVENSDSSRVVKILRKPRKQNRKQKKDVVRYEIFCYPNKKSGEDYLWEANRIQSKLSECLSLYYSQS